MKCSNCNESLQPSKGLVLTHDDEFIAAICQTCCDGVAVGSVAVRRDKSGTFEYSQWSPLSMLAQLRSGKK
jgi:hypothetical protein